MKKYVDTFWDANLNATIFKKIKFDEKKHLF